MADNVLISKRQFEIRQPSYRNKAEEEDFFLKLANTLARKVVYNNMLPDWPESVICRAAMCVTGYFQDILADTGLWRAFIKMNRHLYGIPVPFYKIKDTYIDYELNPEDVRFMTWYSLALNYEDMRIIDPFDSAIIQVADQWYDILEDNYEDAPVPESYKISHGIDLKDNADQTRVFDLCEWMFMYSYLMSPAYSLTLMNIMQEPDMVNADAEKLTVRINQSMAEDPTGPLALYLNEWLQLIIDDKIPSENSRQEDNVGLHKYYSRIISYTGGSPIVFIKGYQNLNRFFIDVLGWSEGESHLPQMQNEEDFVLLADKTKGLLLAKNIAKCIKADNNPYYNKDYAQNHAMELLTVRGMCPADLLRYIQSRDMLPDSHFRGSEDHTLVAENFDFIARCYLQLYYRGD